MDRSPNGWVNSQPKPILIRFENTLKFLAIEPILLRGMRESPMSIHLIRRVFQPGTDAVLEIGGEAQALCFVDAGDRCDGILEQLRKPQVVYARIVDHRTGHDRFYAGLQCLHHLGRILLPASAADRLVENIIDRNHRGDLFLYRTMAPNADSIREDFEQRWCDVMTAYALPYSAAGRSVPLRLPHLVFVEQEVGVEAVRH